MISTIKAWFRQFFGIGKKPVRRAPKKVSPVPSISETKRRLKSQARRREVLRRHNEALADRWFGRGMKGLTALLADTVANTRGDSIMRRLRSGRKRAGFTRRDCTLGHGFRPRRPKNPVKLAPATPYKVYRYVPNKTKKLAGHLMCATNQRATAERAYEQAREKHPGNFFYCVGFEPQELTL